MTIHKPLHQGNDIDGLFVTRKERGRGLTSIEDYVDAVKQRTEDDDALLLELWEMGSTSSLPLLPVPL